MSRETSSPIRLEELLEQSRPDLELAYEVAQKVITPEALFDTARRLADIYGPSSSVYYTLGPEISAIVDELGQDTITFDPNYRETRNPAVIASRSERRVGTVPHFILNHGDEVSYDVRVAGRGEAVLTPLCAHRQKPGISFPAVALRYCETASGLAFLRQVAGGKVVTRKEDEVTQILFVTEHGPEEPLQSGDQVVFDPQPRLELDIDGDTVRGMVDNRWGCAIGIMTARSLAELFNQKQDQSSDLRTLVVADDREEGQFNPPVFSGGAKDLAIALLQPKFRLSHFIVNDGHDFKRGDKIPPAPLISRIGSGNKGIIIGQDRMHRLQGVADVVREMGGQVVQDTEAGAYTSRSSDQGLRDGGISDLRIWPVGYGVIEPHHGDGMPAETSLQNGVETARFLTVLSVAANKGLL